MSDELFFVYRVLSDEHCVSFKPVIVVPSKAFRKQAQSKIITQSLLYLETFSLSRFFHNYSTKLPVRKKAIQQEYILILSINRFLTSPFYTNRPALSITQNISLL